MKNRFGAAFVCLFLLVGLFCVCVSAEEALARDIQGKI